MRPKHLCRIVRPLPLHCIRFELKMHKARENICHPASNSSYARKNPHKSSCRSKWNSRNENNLLRFFMKISHSFSGKKNYLKLQSNLNQSNGNCFNIIHFHVILLTLKIDSAFRDVLDKLLYWICGLFYLIMENKAQSEPVNYEWIPLNVPVFCCRHTVVV